MKIFRQHKLSDFLVFIQNQTLMKVQPLQHCLAKFAGAAEEIATT
jgi:hypothetical protein